MAWNGSGFFLRVHNWVQDALAGINIEASRMDAEDDNFRAGIENCLTKDGQNAPTQDLPMAGKKHVNVGNAVGRDNYLSVGQYQDGWGIYAGDSSGTAAALTATLTPVITAYVVGMRLTFKAHVDCDADATLDVNTIGPRPLQVRGQNVIAGTIKAGEIYAVLYDGVNFEVIGSGTASTFLDLFDTPADYTGQAGAQVLVNSAEDGLEFGPARAKAKMSAALNADIGTAFQEITFDTQEFDTVGTVVDLPNNRFVIPKDGFFVFHFVGAIEQDTNYVWEFQLLINGTPQPGAYRRDVSASVTQKTQEFSGLLELNSGDLITIQVKVNAGLNPDLTDSFFSVHEA